MAKSSVYVENTVVSYLTGRPSRNIVAAAWQEITRDWWALRRQHFTLFSVCRVGSTILGCNH